MADPIDEVKYRPISLLSQVSEVYERIIFNQISTYFEPYFSSFLTDFRKIHNIQYSLLKMLELWKEALDKGKSVGVIFMDLSKVFDNLNHDLLIAKLFTVSPKILLITFKVTYAIVYRDVNNNFSLWKDIFAGVPQGSILGPLMFNIYINEIFLFPDNVCLSNYAEDTNLYLIGENHNTNKNILNKKFLRLQKWFYDNHIVLNPGKCCYISFGSNPDKSV